MCACGIVRLLAELSSTLRVADMLSMIMVVGYWVELVELLSNCRWNTEWIYCVTVLCEYTSCVTVWVNVVSECTEWRYYVWLMVVGYWVELVELLSNCRWNTEWIYCVTVLCEYTSCVTVWVNVVSECTEWRYYVWLMVVGYWVELVELLSNCRWNTEWIYCVTVLAVWLYGWM